MDQSRGQNKHNLFEAAVEFRKALVASAREKDWSFQRLRLQKFPNQCCDVASLLLAYHLRDLGWQNIESCLGYLDRESHVWLEVDGCIVDITASQFEGVDDPVIVAEIGRSRWHSRIDVKCRRQAYPRPLLTNMKEPTQAWE